MNPCRRCGGALKRSNAACPTSCAKKLPTIVDSPTTSICTSSKPVHTGTFHATTANPAKNITYGKAIILVKVSAKIEYAPYAAASITKDGVNVVIKNTPKMYVFRKIR